MHGKRQFILTAMILARPKREQFESALKWAEDLWAFLCAQGYAREAADPKQRQSVDYLARMIPQQRARFGAFWTEYNRVGQAHKGGSKNMAARRWAEIDPGDELALHIIEAAKADAKHWREAQPESAARKHAQGWLHERRFEDYDLPGQNPGPPPKISARAADLAELRHLEMLYQLQPSELLRGQIQALEAKLDMPAR